MVETLFWTAVGCASIAALMGARAAWALLGGALLGELLRPYGVLDSWRGCVSIDAAVILCILYRKPLPLEWGMLALFVPAWVCYALPDPWRYWGSACVVILQLLLTVPLIKHQGASSWVSHGKLHEVQNGKRA